MVTEDLFDNEDSFRFFQLVHMFQRSVLFNLGMLPHEGEEIYDIAEAQEGIELLRMMERKTTGNLDSKEEKILLGIISELQMAYVTAPERQAEYNKRKQQETDIEQAFTTPREGPVDRILEEE